MIFLGADHAGFELKEKIKKHLAKKNIQYEDLGPFELDKNDDYPDYAFKIAQKIAKNKNSRGIFACGSGIGGAIAANKVKGIRALVAYDAFSASYSRLDTDTNFLSLRSRKFPVQKNLKIIDIWLNTKFSNAFRHKRRLKKIEKYEKGNRF